MPKTTLSVFDRVRIVTDRSASKCSAKDLLYNIVGEDGPLRPRMIGLYLDLIGNCKGQYQSAHNLNGVGF